MKRFILAASLIAVSFSLTQLQAATNLITRIISTGGVFSVPGHTTDTWGVTNGGTGANKAGGTALDNISGFGSNVGFVYHSGLNGYGFFSTSAMLDNSLGSTVGSLAYRSAGGWSILSPSPNTSWVLTNNGTGNAPSWQAPGASSTPNVFAFTALKVSPGSASSTQVNVVATRLVLPGATNGLILSSVSVTCSIGSSGANGLDTGSVAPSTWYAVYVISNGTTTACLLSTSATSPSLPSGYTYSARVGWQRTNGSSQLQGVLQYGRSAQWIVDGSRLTALPTIVTGATGSVTTPTYTAFNVVTLGSAPSTASTIKADANVYSSSGGIVFVAPNGNYGLPTSANSPPLSLGISGNGTVGTVLGSIELESQNIYVASGANTNVYSFGWEDNL